MIDFGATRRLPDGVRLPFRKVLAEIDGRILRDQVACRLHVGIGEAEPLADQAAQLRQHTLSDVRALAITVDEQLVSLRPDADAEQRLEVLQVLVVRAEERARCCLQGR